VHCFAFFAPFFTEARAGMRELGSYISEKLAGRGVEASLRPRPTEVSGDESLLA
jgi:hypothetical protein